MQMDFRLELSIGSRVVRLTPYRRIVVFDFGYDFQHRSGSKPSVVGRRCVYVSFDAVNYYVARSINPSDLYNNKRKNRTVVKKAIEHRESIVFWLENYTKINLDGGSEWKCFINLIFSKKSIFIPFKQHFWYVQRRYMCISYWMLKCSPELFKNTTW